MNINFSTFALQCAAMGAWVFLVAGIWALVERVIRAYRPQWLELEAAGASQAPNQFEAPKQPLVEAPKQP
jgi:hypothetical protein